MKRGVWSRSPKTGPRTRSLRVVGQSTSSQLKREIQALLRELAIKRDGGCVLRDYQASAGQCSGPLQAEHLVSRANSATYADMRNIVCLCQRHHIFWKPQNSRLYWDLIKTIIGDERWDWYLARDHDRRPYPMGKADWKLCIIQLQQELAKV